MYGLEEFGDEREPRRAASVCNGVNDPRPHAARRPARPVLAALGAVVIGLALGRGVFPSAGRGVAAGEALATVRAMHAVGETSTVRAVDRTNGDTEGMLLALATGVVALVAAGRLGRRGAATVGVLALAALVGGRAAARAPLLPAWHGLGGTTEWTGEIAGALHRVPVGIVDEGDRVRVLGAGTLSRPAVGTEAVRAGGADVRVLAADEVVRLSPAERGVAHDARTSLRAWRRAGLERLRSWRDPEARAAAAALCFGDRTELPIGWADLFARTGTRHLLAVSGLHVVLLAGALVLPLSLAFAALGKRAPGALGAWLGKAAAWRVALLLALVPVAGSGAPVMRAALVLAMAQLAALLPGKRRADPLSLWATAALFELAVDPTAFDALGHRLSYSAALGLILGHRGASMLFDRGDPAPAGPRRERLRAFVKPFERSLRATLAAALSAGLATLPWIWSWIGEVCPWDPLTTAAALPPLTAFLCASWGWILLPIPPLEWIASRSLAALVGVLELADRLPLTPLPLPPRPLWWLAAASATTVYVLHRRAASRVVGGQITRRSGAGVRMTGALDATDSRANAVLGPNRGRVAGRLAAVLWAGLFVPWAGPFVPSASSDGAWRIDALDVGAGTAVLVQGPDGALLVFDGGSRDRSRVARNALGPSIRAREVRRPTVVLSHDDRDHSGALGWLLERHPPLRWIGACPPRFDERLPDDCPRVDVAEGALVTTWSRGARVIVWRGSESDGNEGSRTVALEMDGARVLLCGDAEEEGLRGLLSSGALDGPWDVVLLPHHGSDGAHVGPFLDATRPREAWISGGGPTRVVDELDRRGIAWRATWRDGPLRASFAPRKESREEPGAEGPPRSRARERSPGERGRSGGTAAFVPESTP